MQDKLMTLNRRPGPAANASYKDDYLFKHNAFSSDNSLKVDSNINSTIKANPYAANVEIEKNELILKPDLSALSRAVGKKHSKGGMDVYLEPDTFIFSDDKTLAISKQEQEAMEFKKGGSFRPKHNTPAEVLKRNVDPKHYNTLINNITDLEKDPLAKKSSARMLEKYIQTIGNVAYLQEQKKGFPTGLPAISTGTAPVYQDDLKEDIMQQKQYAKYGGTILPRAQMGGEWTKYGNALNSKLSQQYKKQNGEVITYKDAINDGMTDFAINTMIKSKQLMPVSGVSQKKSGIPSKETPTSGVPPKTDTTFPGMPTFNEWKNYKEPLKDINTGTVTGKENELSINPEFTPFQKLSQNYNALKYATAKRYMPYRGQLAYSAIDPRLVNPEQVVGDMQAGFNQQENSNNSLSPILRNAQSAAAYGELLNRIPGVRSQYDNQNAATQNQFAQYNDQKLTGIRDQNLKNDQQYYKDSVVGQQNFDNLRDFLGDQWMNNVTRDTEANQALAYTLATQRPLTNGKLPYEFNFRNGNWKTNAIDIRDIPSNGGQNTLEAMLEFANKVNNSGLPESMKNTLLKNKKLDDIIPLLKGRKGGMFRPKN